MSQLRPCVLRFGTIVGQSKIELQDFRGEGLDGDVLARINAVGGPDEEAEDESGQQCKQTDDRADHVLPPPVRCFSGRTRCNRRPSDPAANTATPTANANFSGFIRAPPDGDPSGIRVVSLPPSRRLPLSRVERVVRIERHSVVADVASVAVRVVGPFAIVAVAAQRLQRPEPELVPVALMRRGRSQLLAGAAGTAPAEGRSPCVLSKAPQALAPARPAGYERAGGRPYSAAGAGGATLRRVQAKVTRRLGG